MVYPIVKYGDPVLEREAENVTEFDTPELHKFLEDMFESMYAAKGVGLAAPQIGVGAQDRRHRLSRMARDPDEKIVLINPEDHSRRRQAGGRRRLPEHSRISRAGARAASSVTVRAQNAKGESFEQTGEDLLARAFLHETDHLYGTLYISHISALKRDLIRRKIRKLAKRRRMGARSPNARWSYLGTPAFAVPTLERIVEAGHQVLAVVTQPDRPKGRGPAPAASPVKEAALRLGLPVFQPERIRRPEARGAPARACAPTPWWWSATARSFRNRSSICRRTASSTCTRSLLPKYRGAAPIQWAIANGETRHRRHHHADRRGARHRRHAAARPRRRSARKKRPSSWARAWP